MQVPQFGGDRCKAQQRRVGELAAPAQFALLQGGEFEPQCPTHLCRFGGRLRRGARGLLRSDGQQHVGQADTVPFAPALDRQSVDAKPVQGDCLRCAVYGNAGHLKGLQCDPCVRQLRHLFGREGDVAECQGAARYGVAQCLRPVHRVVEPQVKLSAVQLEGYPGSGKPQRGSQVDVLQLQVAAALPGGDGQFALPAQLAATLGAGAQLVGLAPWLHRRQIRYREAESVQVRAVGIRVQVIGYRDACGVEGQLSDGDAGQRSVLFRRLAIAVLWQEVGDVQRAACLPSQMQVETVQGDAIQHQATPGQ